MAKPVKKKKTPRPVVAYEPKGYDPKRITQRIRSQDLFENLDFDPKYLPHLYVDNVILRAFARIIGQGPTGPVVIKTTADGSLATVSRGGAFDAYERLDYTFAALAETHDFIFSRQMERIDIFTYNGKTSYQISRDLVQPLGSLIPLFEDSFYSLDFFTLRLKATCDTFTALTPTRSTIFGWYRLEG